MARTCRLLMATCNGLDRAGIVRLNADGTLDGNFQYGILGANDFVRSVAVQRDGKVLIGGGFTSVNGVRRTSIARLNADGTLDNGFQNGASGADYEVRSIAIQTDGKVLIRGSFRTLNGVRRNGIARLNPDGTLDVGFQNGLSGAAGEVYAVAVQTDGKVLIGGGSGDGGFGSVNGGPAPGIARLCGNQPAYIESVTRPNSGRATLTLRLPPDSTNRVQYKTDLNDAAWIDLPGDVIMTGTDSLTNKVDATLSVAQRRFYRVRQLP
jgi:uncharacterized delta-60 repeat protein